jgi:cellulose synthase/poly-beta-1,6-N-acetylglucosamine synthase-like glycosyltransferase
MENVVNSQSHPPQAARKIRFKWWLASVGLMIVALSLSLLTIASAPNDRGSEAVTPIWVLITAIFHLPFLAALVFKVFGIFERIGYFWRGRKPEVPGTMPLEYPKVCVQLPMFNEHAVARRVIEAAAKMDWPKDRLLIQVLDDSTDEDTRRLVDSVCAEVRMQGIDCRARHRTNRQGYKAGALEEGRMQMGDSEFVVIFDADFVPPPDYLLRAIPHFYHQDGTPDTGLALVQAQWGHLNHAESALTLSQSLWVDDHHTLQMSWRSEAWEFVNFTGTAGVWRASAIEDVGGWKATSLVEDCELSFRHLFAGYRTKFIKEIVVPSELPTTYTAYKAQQKRWTQGWVQLQRMHLGTMLFNYKTSPLRWIHLLYQLTISWQWPIWMLWIMTLPFLIYNGYWLGAVDATLGLMVYLFPSVVWLALSATLASIETKYTYKDPLTVSTFMKRALRVFPQVFISTGLLPHQFSAFVEGLFGSFSSEFERTPKAASVNGAAKQGQTLKKRYKIKIHWPNVLAEAIFVAFQLSWAYLFFSAGLVWCGIGALFLTASVLYVAFYYGDHMGRVCFIIDPKGLRRMFAKANTVSLLEPSPSPSKVNS